MTPVFARLGRRRTRDVTARLLAYTKWADGCTLWQGSLTHDGYGRISVKGVDRLAHVVSYELRFGPVPAGLVLDHSCRRRSCCNPEHLEPVTILENTRRGLAPSTVAAREGRCLRGHELPGGGGRCRVCHAEAKRRFYLAKRESLRAASEVSQ